MEPTLPRRMASAPRPSRAATSLRRRRSRRQGALSAEAQRRAALCPLHSMTNAISEMQCCPTQRCLARAEDASVTTFPSRGSHGVKNRFCTLICTSLLSQGLYCSFRKCTPQRERARKMGGLWRTPRTLLDPPHTRQSQLRDVRPPLPSPLSTLTRAKECSATQGAAAAPPDAMPDQLSFGSDIEAPLLAHVRGGESSLHAG